MGSFAEGRAEAEPGFLFVWDPAHPLVVHVLQGLGRGEQIGIFRWSLRAFSFVFPSRERWPPGSSKSWPGGVRHEKLEGGWLM